MASTHCPIHWRTFGCWRMLEWKKTVKGRKITVECNTLKSLLEVSTHYSGGGWQEQKVQVPKPQIPFVPLYCWRVSLTAAKTHRISNPQKPGLPHESHTHPPTTPHTKNKSMQLMNYTKLQIWLQDKLFFSWVSSQPDQLLFQNCSKTTCANAAEGMKFLQTNANNLSLNANIATMLEITKKRKLFTDQSFTAHPDKVKHTKLYAHFGLSVFHILKKNITVIWEGK